MNFLVNATLKQLMGWAESEVNQNGNRIKAAIYGLILAALTKVSVAVFHAQIPAEYLPQAQQLADWVSNATLAGAGAVVAAWTARPAGSPAAPVAPVAPAAAPQGQGTVKVQ